MDAVVYSNIDLHDLQQNKAYFFSVSYYTTLNRTLEQWTILLNALLNNTSVVTVHLRLKYCPVETIPRFVDYLRTSRKLKNVIIEYDVPFTVPKGFRAKIDSLLRAVRQNPSIQKLQLSCLGFPQSIRDLLTGNTTLTSFTLADYHGASKAVARSIAAGLRGNKTLKEIGIFGWSGKYLDIMVSGLGHRQDKDNSSMSQLESLSVSHRFETVESNPRLGLRVLEAIKCNPSLKRLIISGETDYGVELEEQPRHAWIGDLLKKLYHPDCTGLKTLELRDVPVGTNVDDYDVMVPANWIVPVEQANKTLKEVRLYNVHVGNSRSARLFWNLRGLTRLYIEGLFFRHQGDEEEEEEDNDASDLEDDASTMVVEEDDQDDDENELADGEEEAAPNENNRCHFAVDDNDVEPVENEGGMEQQAEDEDTGHDHWAEFIHQCAELGQVHIDDAYYDLYASVLRGACGHANLQELILKSTGPVILDMPGERVQSLFQQLLRETPSLRTLHLDCIGQEQDLAAGVAGGLPGNESLQKLSVMMHRMQATNYHTILDSLFENRTLRHFGNSTSCGDYSDSRRGDLYESHASQEICGTLSRVFLVNKSLYHIALPRLDLQGNVTGLLDGFCETPTLRSLDCGNLQTDTAGSAALQQALMHNANIHLEHIVLPYIAGAGVLKDFLRCLSQIWRFKTVDLGYNVERYPNDDCWELLLLGAKQNKTMISLGTSLNYLYHPILLEIRYYLKLNHFGRKILDSTNIPSSLWPSLLVSMTSQEENADALFYFIQQYFTRQSYPLPRHQQQQQQPEPHGAPPPKRARVDGGVAGGRGDNNASF